MKKPVVHYKGNPSFSSGFAFLVAIDHPRFPANFPVRTSRVLRHDEKTGRIETLNTIYVKKEESNETV